MRKILLFLAWRKICEAPFRPTLCQPSPSCFSPASDEEGEAEESGDLLSAQKVPRGEIFGSRRSQSCSGDRLSKGNDWTGPGRPTGWRTLVLLRSLPTIYSPPIASRDSPSEICVLFRPNPFFRFPAPVCVNRAGVERSIRDIPLHDFNVYRTIRLLFIILLLNILFYIYYILYIIYLSFVYFFSEIINNI